MTKSKTKRNSEKDHYDKNMNYVISILEKIIFLDGNRIR